MSIEKANVSLPKEKGGGIIVTNPKKALTFTEVNDICRVQGELVDTVNKNENDIVAIQDSTSIIIVSSNSQMLSKWDELDGLGKTPIDGSILIRNDFSPNQYWKWDSNEPNKGLYTNNDVHAVEDKPTVGSTKLVESDGIINFVEKIKEEALSEVYELSSNLLNAVTVIQGEYIRHENGVTGFDVSWWRTGFIKIKPSTLYWFTDVRDLAFYYAPYSEAYISGDYSGSDSITSPSNANYIRFSNDTEFDENTYMFNEGVAKLPFEKYKRTFKFDYVEVQKELEEVKKYEILLQNNSLNYGAKKAFEYINRLKDEESFDLPNHRKLALIELFQNLYKADLFEKLIVFLPFFGTNVSALYNIIDSYYDATIFSVGGDTKVDENGLIPNRGVIKIDNLKLNNIPYRDDGQPKVGFGHLYDGQYNGGSYSDWRAYVDIDVSVRFSDVSTNKAEISIGSQQKFTTQNIPKDSHYYLAQRDGDELKLFTKYGVSGSLTETGLSKLNLQKDDSGEMSFQNQDTDGTRKKASFIIKALSNAEERVFYNLLNIYHTKIQ